MALYSAETVVIGAGIVGIATAYHLAVTHKRRGIVVVESHQPMAFTSAASGENYRNWWSNPTMTAFTDHSVDLLEGLARRTGNRFKMTRRGYVLATRDPQPSTLIDDLYRGYGSAGRRHIRIHDGARSEDYEPATSEDWEAAPAGVDVLSGKNLIRNHFPEFDPDVATVLHIRRAGDISGQQLGQYMLEEFRAAGGRLVIAEVKAIERTSRFILTLAAKQERDTIEARSIVIAAGPFSKRIAAMLGEALPVQSVLQQKIAFPDVHAAVSRRMPFCIDLDGQSIAWSDDERDALREDPDLRRFTGFMPGSMHCRPEGGERSNWIKIGWAFNQSASDPVRSPEFDPHYPEIVIRAVSRLLPRLRSYVGNLPRGRVLYGGYYTMTEENWPLIGPTRIPGVFINAALSGYGTMGACAAGDICARSVVGAPLPAFAAPLSPARYNDPALLTDLRQERSKGLL